MGFEFVEEYVKNIASPTAIEFIVGFSFANSAFILFFVVF